VRPLWARLRGRRRLARTRSRQPTRQWRRLSSCQTLQSQVPALEDWLDRQMAAGHAVLISGDFNRDLRQELRQGLPARGDGSPAAAPIRTSDEMRHVASVLPELDDDQPRGTRLTLVASGPYRKLARCHHHIDVFLLSHNLDAWLRTPLEDLRVQVDGGITAQTIERAAEAGADVFVAGSAVYRADDALAAVRELRKAASSHRH